MRLSELMSNMDLSIYPQIGLVMFLLIFTVVVARILNRNNNPIYEQASLIPLTEDVVTPRSQTATATNGRVEEGADNV